jgi:hypothetical protein
MEVRLKVLYEVEALTGTTGVEDGVSRGPRRGNYGVRILDSFVHARYATIKAVETTDDRLIVTMIATVDVVEVNAVSIAMCLKITDDAEHCCMATRFRARRDCNPIYDQRLSRADLRKSNLEWPGQVGGQNIVAADRHDDVLRGEPFGGSLPYTVRDSTRSLNRPDLTDLPIAATELDLGLFDDRAQRGLRLEV